MMNFHRKQLFFIIFNELFHKNFFNTDFEQVPPLRPTRNRAPGR